MNYAIGSHMVLRHFQPPLAEEAGHGHVMYGIPEHGALENVWGKRFFLVLSFTRAPRTEFGETLGRCSR